MLRAFGALATLALLVTACGAGSPPPAPDVVQHDAGIDDVIESAVVEPPPPNPGRVVDLASGDLHTCAVTDRGGLFCWGNGGPEELKRPDDVPDSVPARVPGVVDAVEINRRGERLCVNRKLGCRLCWSARVDGWEGWQEPTGNEHFSYSPPQCKLEGDESVCKIGVEKTKTIEDSEAWSLTRGPYYYDLCGRSPRGNVFCWNWSGRRYKVATKTAAITRGGRLCALGKDGVLRCYEHDHPLHKPDPLQEVDRPGTDVIAFAADDDIGCSLLPDGELRCFGWRHNWWEHPKHGHWELIGLERVPLRSIRVPDATSFVLGIGHVCALADGEVWCAGRVVSGQLGDRRPIVAAEERDGSTPYEVWEPARVDLHEAYDPDPWELDRPPEPCKDEGYSHEC